MAERAIAIVERARSKILSALHDAGGGRLDAALEQLDEVLRTYGRTGIAELDVHIASAMYNKAAVLHDMGQHERSLSTLSDVVDRFEAHRDVFVVICAMQAASKRALHSVSVGREQEALLDYQRIVARLSDIAEPSALELFATALLHESRIHSTQGRTDGALACCERAIDRLKLRTEPKPVCLLVTARGMKADILCTLGRREEALAIHVESLRLIEGLPEPQLLEPRARTFLYVAELMRELGRGEQALAVYDSMVATFASYRELPLRQHVAGARLNKANTLVDLGRFDEAARAFAEVVERVGASTDRVLFECVNAALIGWMEVLTRLGRIGEAEGVAAIGERLSAELEAMNTSDAIMQTLREHAIASGPSDQPELFDAIAREALDAPHPVDATVVARALNDKGVALAHAERFAEAIEQWQRALTVLGERTDLEACVPAGTALSFIGSALLRLDRTREAAEVFESVLQRFGHHTDRELQSCVVRAELALSEIERVGANPRMTMASLKAAAALTPFTPRDSPLPHYIRAEIQLRPPVVQFEYVACDEVKNLERITGTALVLSLMKRIRTNMGKHYVPPEITLNFNRSGTGARMSDPETGASQVARLDYGVEPPGGWQGPDANYELLVEALAMGLSVEHALECTHIAGAADLLGYDNSIVAIYPGQAAMCLYVPRSHRP